MSEKAIERAVREAYRYGNKVATPGDRVKIVGESGGLNIEMWGEQGDKDDRNSLSKILTMREFFVVDRTVLERNRSGTVSAHISLNFAGEMFPSSGWDDFAVAILTAAIHALLRLARRESIDENVHFMEGPFVLQLTLLDSGNVRMRGIKEASRSVVQHEQVVSLIALAVDLRHAVENLLAWCRSENWTSTDEKMLEGCLSELQNELLNKLQ